MTIRIRNLPSPVAERWRACKKRLNPRLQQLLASLAPLADESGQVLVLTALCMTVLIGMLALAIDVGMLRYQKRQFQNAADAAALAAALEIATCGSTANCPALRTAAETALQENGLSAGAVFTNCSNPTGTGVRLTINNPPCAMSADPNLGNKAFVEILVSANVPTVFAKVLGIKSVPVLARSESTMRPQATSPCVYALDPTGSGIQLSGATVDADCGVLVESPSGGAFQCSGSSINAPSIAVVGSLQNAGCTFSTVPKAGATLPNPADPLSSLPKPAIPPCGTSTSSPYHGSSSVANITGTATLYPDFAYCGGITISSTAHVTLSPGTYVLFGNANDSGLRLCVQATVTGTGVTFYNAGTSGAITLYNVSTGTGGISLRAPTSGPHAGILFFQNANNSSQATLLGTSQWNTILEGGYYFPSATVVFNYSGAVNYNFLIARDIQFVNLNSTSAGHSIFTNDYSSLQAGSPLGSSSPSLMQ